MTPDEALQPRIETIGRALLGQAKSAAGEASTAERWIQAFMHRLAQDVQFRVQALRFIDVLPALTDDAELARHVGEYFGRDEFPLPAAIRWGIGHARSGPAPHVIAPVVRKAVEWIGQRFIAGEHADEAYQAIEHLHEKSRLASLDILGEIVLSEAEADDYQRQYLELIEALAPRLDTLGEKLQLSIKVSSLYSQINPLAPEKSSEAIRTRLRPVARAVRQLGGGITLDMEHYDTKDITLRVFRDMLSEPEFTDWPDCGVAMQAYLKDTEHDLKKLIDWAQSRPVPVGVRLVRGAYWDAETVIARREGWDVPVWEEKWQTDDSYERCLAMLLTHHQAVRPVIASHNVRSIALALALIEKRGLKPPDYEFQMLYGMAGALQTALTKMGHPLRIYVPIGPIIPGMAYLVRRLLENSANTSFLRLAFAEDRPEEEMLAPPKSGGSRSVHLSSTFRNEPVRRFTREAERREMAEAIGQVRSELGRRYPLIIGGKPVETSATITSVNPANPSEIIGETAAAGTAEADTAVKIATAAVQHWKQVSTAKRSEVLRRAAELLGKQREIFAAWEILEAGKPWREADADVTEAIDYLRYYADLADRMACGYAFDVAGETNRYIYQPYGVAVVIPPWNFPLAILTGMLSAGIAAGNAVIVKPSSQAPVIAARFIELLMRAGIPEGVVQFLPGEGARLGEYLVQHPGVHLIAFTGSMAVGCRIQQLAVAHMQQQGHAKHAIAEMGGKNAIIVDADADLDDAVAGIVASAFGYAGQKCSACSRVITVGNTHDALVHRLKEGTQSLIIGPPEEPGAFVGPVISASAKKRIMQRIQAGQTSAHLAAQVDISSYDNGYFVAPTLFTEVATTDALAQEEIFGPVLALLHADTFEEAIGIANGTAYALTGGVYSRSPAHLELARKAFQVGNLYLNRKITGAVVGRQPFGGFALSGTGHKAGGPDYLLQFVQARTITENTLRRGFAPAPSGRRDNGGI